MPRLHRIANSVDEAPNSGKMRAFKSLSPLLTTLLGTMFFFAFVIKGERQMVAAITESDESIKIILRPSPVAL